MTTAIILEQDNLIQLNKKMLKAMIVGHISRNGTFSENELNYYDQIFKDYELKNI